MLWVLPLLTVLQPILRLRAIAEHGAVADLSSPLTAARTNRTSGSLVDRLARALLFPHHVNHHLEHHLYPAVPHYHLPALHQLLRAKGALAGAEVRDVADTMRAESRFAPHSRRIRAAPQQAAASATTKRGMSELILHHYDTSPFAEKVRMVLGYKRLHWRSVKIPIVAPKPDLVALTGGYRRTPVLQIGADIYCDSALICRTLDRLQPAPPLYPDDQPLAESVSAWIDSAMFWTVMPVAFQPAALAQIFVGVPADDAQRFAADRAAFTTGMRRVTRVDAMPQFATYFGRFERQLADGRGFLFGDAPTIADFSLAHNVWFVWRLPALAHLLAPYERVGAWCARMRAFGHGTHENLEAIDALRLAAEGEPTAPASFDNDAGFERGEPVTVAAIDYGTDPVAGSLIALTRDEIALRREDERAGAVVVHFPRIGFQVRRQEKTA